MSVVTPALILSGRVYRKLKEEDNQRCEIGLF